MSKYSWNPVYERLMEMKRKAGEAGFSFDYNKSYETGKTILHEMSGFLGGEYDEWLNTLKVKQKGSFVLLHYDLLSALDMWNDTEDINREARSITIDMDKEEIVLCPFGKFFNIGEAENDVDSIKRAIVETPFLEVAEKMDGSNINAALYDGKIVSSSSGSLDEDDSFQLKIANEMLENKNYSDMISSMPDHTFIFELIHPDDPHVVDYHGEKGLYLITARNKFDGKILPYSESAKIADKYGVKHVKTFKYGLSELEKYKETLKACDSEGFVLNIAGRYVKYKTDDYLALHKVVSGNKPFKTRVYEAVRDGIFDDFYSCLTISSRKREAAFLAEEILKLESEKNGIVEDFVNKNKDLPRKEFAQKVFSGLNPGLSHYAFSMLDGKEERYFPDLSDIPDYEEEELEENDIEL